MFFCSLVEGEDIRIEIKSNKLYIKESSICLENDVLGIFFSKTKWFLLYNYTKNGKLFLNNIYAYDYLGNFLYKVGDLINVKDLCFTGISSYTAEKFKDAYIVCGTFDCVNYIIDAINDCFVDRRQVK